MLYVNAIQYRSRIVGIYIADEFCFHFECVIYLSPVLQSQIHGTGPQVTAADTDLHNSGKFLSCRVCNFAIVNLICKFCNFLLLLNIKAALVHTIGLDSSPQLAPGHMMKHSALLSGIDHLAIVKSFEFPGKLCLLCQFF